MLRESLVYKNANSEIVSSKRIVILNAKDIQKIIARWYIVDIEDVSVPENAGFCLAVVNFDEQAEERCKYNLARVKEG